MVKNTTGGTGTKGLARKHQNSAGGGGGGGGAIRLPKNALEQIVIVTKLLGNGMCEVFNNDDKRFIAHIRAKFKGRNRRSNDILLNSFILVGLRDWENPVKNVDVLCVYDHNDINIIISNPIINTKRICARTNDLNSIHTDYNTNTNNTNTNTNTNDFEFSTLDDNLDHNEHLPTLSNSISLNHFSFKDI